jgi:hypothetical protein
MIANQIKGGIMKKLLLITSLMMLGLSGCYVAPYRGHDDGYQNEQDHRENGSDRQNRDGHDDRHDGSNDNHNPYH